jgi:hypothetical protein
VPPEIAQAAPVVIQRQQPPPPPAEPLVFRWTQAMMPAAHIVGALPAGTTAFDVLRLNARAPAMNRKSPDSFVQAVHEWRGLGLESFRKVRKTGWAKPDHTAYRKRLYVIDLVRRAVPTLPAHESFLMNSIEREDWAACRYDYLRGQANEEMCKYIEHIRLVDDSIVRRDSKKKRARADDDGEV